jgi:hypothetical protein
MSSLSNLIRNPDRLWLILGSLALLTIAGVIYMQVAGHDFVAFDDHLYVFSNQQVLQGLNWEGVKYSFYSLDAVNFHPFTWLSHMADVSMFGPGDPGMHSLHNAIWHAGAGILAFLAIRRWFGSAWLGFFFACVFVAHPANVESVAWISQRKSVINAFFVFATILAYARYLESRTLARYISVILLFWCSMLAKSASVTLPFLMLVVDVLWHRRARLPWIGPEAPGLAHWWNTGECRRLLYLAVEKLPLIFLSAVVSSITFIAQRDGGAMPPTDFLGYVGRFYNAANGYITYILMFLFPRELSGFYPQVPVNYVQMYLNYTILACITLLCLRVHRTRPLLLIGWLWFIGTLVPMIGLVQVGAQAYADRYLYLSIGGLCLIAWEIGKWLTDRGEARPVALGALAGVWIATLTITATGQVFTWRDSYTFFNNTLEVTGRHRFSIINTAGQAASARDFDRAEALLGPGSEFSAEARALLGMIQLGRGDLKKGREILEQALLMSHSRDAIPSNALFTLARLQHSEGDREEALRNVRRVRRMLPISDSWNKTDNAMRAVVTQFYLALLQAEAAPDETYQTEPMDTSLLTGAAGTGALPTGAASW